MSQPFAGLSPGATPLVPKKCKRQGVKGFSEQPKTSRRQGVKGVAEAQGSLPPESLNEVSFERDPSAWKRSHAFLGQVVTAGASQSFDQDGCDSLACRASWMLAGVAYQPCLLFCLLVGLLVCVCGLYWRRCGCVCVHTCDVSFDCCWFASMSSRL